MLVYIIPQEVASEVASFNRLCSQVTIFPTNLISSIIHPEQPRIMDSSAPLVSNSHDHQIKCQPSFFQMISRNISIAPLAQH